MVLYQNTCLILYLYRMTAVTTQRAKSKSELTQFSRTKSFNNTFFLFCVKEWNELDAKIRNLPYLFRLFVFCFAVCSLARFSTSEFHGNNCAMYQDYGT